MTKRRFSHLPQALLGALVVILFTAGPALARKSETISCKRIPELSRTYLHKHISFHYVNDELRERMIETYVKRLDPSKSLYLAHEIAALKSHLKVVLQEVREGRCDSLIEIQKDLIKRYEAMEKYARGVLADETYTLDPDTVLIIDPDKRSHARTPENRDELITKLIHFQMSNYLSSDMELAEAKQKLTHRYELMTKRVTERTEEDIYSGYLDAFASSLDPHSNYLSRDVLEDFQISMELSLDGIGVALSSRDGYSVVEKVIPGGAADSLDILEPNDKIISVAQDGGDTVDIIDMDLRDVVRMIRGKRGTKVHLTILRQGDTAERFRITITRDTINLEEQAAKLRIETVDIDGEPTKLAILDLPSFYGGRDPGERQSSRDLERLLGEAKEAGAKGLLLDLSRNGGGLLETSVDIAGFFIKEGGVVAVKDTFSKVQVLEDRDSGISWDGPMVVLTSRVSASASEIVAGALKDYQRALIVGDDHTFGKGTVQSMVPLQQGLGALKVTTALFFRPGGLSTQNRGVRSDVVVPSVFGTDDFGERHQTYSLPEQKIDAFIDKGDRPANGTSPIRVPWMPITPEVVNELSARSAKRVAESEDFKQIDERIAKARERNGVVHLDQLMKEKEESNAAPGDASTKTPSHGDAVVDPEVEDDEEAPSPQQLEAVQILADLIRLQT